MEKHKIRQIKTVLIGVRTNKDIDADTDCTEFDERVNEALADGWYLVRRYSLPARTQGSIHALVAELQRYVDHE